MAISIHSARYGIRTGLGFLGQLTSLCLFCSPMLTMHNIHKKKDVEGFSVNPYLAGIINCLMLMFYGLPFITKSNSLSVVTNMVGLILEISYVALYYKYSKTSKKRRYIVRVTAGLFAAFALAVGLLLRYSHGSRRAFILGLMCMVFSLCLYGMPLDVVGQVIITKNSEYLPLYLCLAGYLNSSTWTLYSVMTEIDFVILVSNGLGAILGVIQIMIWIIYHNGPKGGDSKPNQPEHAK